MAHKDKIRWNEKYKNNKIPNEPLKVISDYTPLAIGKQALDIACGMGRHSKFLASEGFKVDALDISSVAIAHLQNENNINAKEVDFDNHTIPKERYNLIVCTYFLERKLFPQMISALKTNGMIILETFLYHPENERKVSNPNFLLHIGELKTLFNKECELIYISEFWDKDYLGFKTMKTSMVARKK